MVALNLSHRSSAELAQAARVHALQMVHAAKASHIGSALSVIDILAVLYNDILNYRVNDPDWVGRDRFLLSKGHAAVTLYAILGEIGFFPVEEFASYGQDGARLMGHASHFVPGVEYSSGSLGHALSVGCGLALGLHANRQRVFTVLSDGELDEGSNWEAILFAGHHRLHNLTAVIDYNRLQSFGPVADVLDLSPLDAKFECFGWRVQTVDGHDHDALHAALRPVNDPRPSVVIANTTKGKGVDFMENELVWHYRSPNDIQLASALRQVKK